MRDVDLQRMHARLADPASQAAWAALPMPLREFGEIAGQRLSQSLADALRHAAQLLFSDGAQALTAYEREAMLDAAEFGRKYKDRLVADFLSHFEQRYVRACQYKPTLMTAFRIDFDAHDLQIVNHDLLDDSLEPGLLAQDIQNLCWGSLHILTRHFGKLLGAEAIGPNDMPLSPRLIEAALSDAVRSQTWRHDAKFRLVRRLRKYLPEQVDRLYCDLAELMDPAVQRCATEFATFPVLAAEPGGHASGRAGHDPVVEKRTNQLVAPPVDPLAGALALAAERKIAARSQGDAAAGLGRRVVSDGHAAPQRTRLLAAAGTSQVEAGPVHAAPGVQAELAKSKPKGQVVSSSTPRSAVSTALRQGVAARAVAQTQAASPAEPVPPGDALAGLKSGAWLALRNAAGGWQELKLAWISPHRSLFVLTNRRGERALSLVAADLAAALREGRARIVMPREANTSDPGGRITKKTA